MDLVRSLTPALQIKISNQHTRGPVGDRHRHMTFSERGLPKHEEFVPLVLYLSPRLLITQTVSNLIKVLPAGRIPT